MDSRRSIADTMHTLAAVCLWALLAGWLSACTPAATPLPTGRWIKRASMEEERSWIGMGVVGGKIYAVGGMVGQMGRRLNSGEVYDPKTDRWSPIAPMPTARSSAGLAAVAGKLHVIGGYPQSGTSDVVEVYDPAANTWRTGLTPMPTKRFDMGIAAIGPLIYTFGGYDARSMAVVEVYDTARDAWESLPPMPTPRYALQAAVVDGKLWAMGGRNDLGATDVIEVYDPARRAWVRGGSLPEPLAGYGAVVAGKRLHVAKYDKHWAMELPSGRWQKLAPMLTSRHGLQLAHMDGVVYAVGGCTPGEGNLFDVARNEAFVWD